MTEHPRRLCFSESILTPGGTATSASGTAPSPPRLQLVAADGSTNYHYRPLSKWFDTANTTATSYPLSWKGGDASLVDGTSCASKAELSLGFDWGAILASEIGNTPAKVNQVVNSRHGGIMIASFCDGHQSQISESMDTNTFKHLVTPDSAAAAVYVPTIISGAMGPVGILSESDM